MHAQCLPCQVAMKSKPCIPWSRCPDPAGSYDVPPPDKQHVLGSSAPKLTQDFRGDTARLLECSSPRFASSAYRDVGLRQALDQQGFERCQVLLGAVAATQARSGRELPGADPLAVRPNWLRADMRLRSPHKHTLVSPSKPRQVLAASPVRAGRVQGFPAFPPALA